MGHTGPCLSGAVALAVVKVHQVTANVSQNTCSLVRDDISMNSLVVAQGWNYTLASNLAVAHRRSEILWCPKLCRQE